MPMHASNAGLPELESTVTQKGQVTIPKEIRQRLGLKPRDRVRFHVQEGAVTLARASASVVERTAGAVTPLHGPEDLEALREGFEEGVAQEVIESMSREPGGRN